MLRVSMFLLLCLALAVATPAIGAEREGATDPTHTIVVTASRISQPLVDAPASIDVIPREAIEQTGAATLGEALELAAGLSVVYYGGRGSIQQASIRGSTSQQVLLLVDGAPVASPQGMFNLAQLPLADVQRIEVLKGPGSALYGADAVGGVVNVITAPAVSASGSRIQVRGGGGDFELVGRNAGRIGPTGYRVTLGSAGSQGHRPNGNYQEQYVGVRLDRELSPRSDGYLQLTWFTSEGGIPGSLHFPIQDARQNDAQMRFEAAYTQDVVSGQLRATLYGRRYDREYRDNFEESRHETETIGGEIQRDIHTKLGTVTVGGVLRKDEVESSNLVDGRKSASSSALFAQWVHGEGSRTTVTTGLRVDTHSAYPGPVSPRVGVRTALSAATVLRASVGRSFRAPTFDDLYWTGFGNPDLRPEDGWHYEVGMRRLFSQGDFDLALFRRDVSNLIRWAPDENDVWRPHNIAESSTQGMDLALSAHLSPSVRATFNWTLQDARDAGSGDRLALIPAHEAGVTLGYQSKTGGAALSMQHRGGRVDQTGAELAAYTVVNARINRAFGASIEAFVEAKNLLDRDYEVTQGYPMPGRTVWFGTSYAF